MLRMTVLDNAESVTFQLEGTLADCWVGEVERCRQHTMARRRRPGVRFDPTGVTDIDAAVKANLAAMLFKEAELVAADCLTKAVVAEISKAPISDGGRP